MEYHIYKLTSPNGRVYIGQTKQIKRRWSLYKGINNKRSPISQKSLLYSLLKYGWDNFTKEIIEEVEDITKLDEREIYWIAYYKCNRRRYPQENGLNLTDGGKGILGFKHSKYTRKNISKRNLGKITTGIEVVNLETGIFFESVKEAASYYNYTFMKILAMLSGKSKRILPLYYLQTVDTERFIEYKDQPIIELNKILPPTKTGVRLSEEHKIKIGLANKGKTTNFFRGKKRNSETTEKRKLHPNFIKRLRPIIQKNLNGEIIKEWDSISEAENSLNLNHSNIISALKGSSKTSGGFIWEYKYTK